MPPTPPQSPPGRPSGTGSRRDTAAGFAPLRRLIDRARRRALALGAGTTLAALLCVGLMLSLPVAFVLGNADLEEVHGLFWLQQSTLGLLFLASLAALTAFFFLHWRRLATDGQLALRLERRLDEGAGLSSAVEFHSALHPEEPAGEEAPTRPGVGYSELLAEAHIETVARRLEQAPLEKAFPAQSLGRAAGALALLAAAALVALLLPGSPVARGYQRLFSLERGIGLLGKGGASAVPELITGDVSLTYHYPAYTRRPSRTVSGTGGEITALPGTEVEIRTTADREVEAAALLVGESRFPLEVSAGRSLRGKLLVREPGEYRFAFLDDRGRIEAEGAPHRIAVEPDAWPEAELKLVDRESDEHQEIDRDEVLPLQWEVEDDFGVGEVALVWRIRGGQEKRRILTDLEERPGGDGSLRWELATLRLSAGETVTVHLEVTDNDVVSGPKVGRSRSYTLEVFSKVAHHRALIEQIEQAWRQLIATLADHLEGPCDPEAALTGQALNGEVERMRALVTGLNTLIADLKELEGSLASDPLGPEALQKALRNIFIGIQRETGRLEAALHQLETRLGLEASRLRPMASHLARSQERVVIELEKDVIFLEDLLDRERMQALKEITQALQESKRRLESLVDQLKENPSEEVRQEIGEEIARLKERIFELMRRMQELAKSIRDENLNQEAMQQIQENQDLLSQLDDLQKLINEGKLEEALAQLQKMSEQLDELMQRFEKGEQSVGGEKYEELMREMNAFRDELERLRHDQDELLEESRGLKERYQKELEKRVTGKLDELAKRLKAKAEAAKKKLEEMPPEIQDAVVGLYDRETLDQAASRLEETRMLLEARDFDEALKTAQEALRNVATVRGLFQDARRDKRLLRRMLPPQVGLSPEELEKALKEGDGRVDEAHQLSRELVEELEQLFPDPREVFGKQEQQRLSQMGREQDGLRQRASKLGQQMRSIAEKAPIFSPEMEQTLREGQRHMSEASQRLSQSDARRATGQEQAAAERLSELGEQLEEAMKQQGESGMPIPMSSSNSSGGRMTRSEPVEIPDAEAYKAPEAFRKELLEAMKEGAPDRYQDQVKRYYEELVR
ncbi:MAG: hypothetical protein P1V51_24100 [Deltaproteobacteria bacterium]|nr:hypothetical protein [Deltaproteobacteria bacterium]